MHRRERQRISREESREAEVKSIEDEEKRNKIP